MGAQEQYDRAMELQYDDEQESDEQDDYEAYEESSEQEQYEENDGYDDKSE